MRRVILESPLAGDVEANLAYARRCLADSLSKGEAPIASHLLYPQVLDDLEPGQRKQGIAAGHAWIAVADAMVVYCDRGISVGMVAGIKEAGWRGCIKVEFRALYKPASKILAQARDLFLSPYLAAAWITQELALVGIPQVEPEAPHA